MLVVDDIDDDDIGDERLKHLNKLCLLSCIDMYRDVFSATEELIVW